MTEYLIDTSVVIGQYKNEIPYNKLEKLTTYRSAISIVSIYELNKYLRNEGKIADWNEMKLGLTKYQIIGLDLETCELAGELANSKGLSAADSLIYATALKNNLRLLTRDSDFEKLEKVEVI